MVKYVDPFDAMCVWEAILENPEVYPGAERYRENNGVCETRQRVIEMTFTISEAWEWAKDAGYEGPFDFEFVPDALKWGSTAVDKYRTSLEMHPLFVSDPKKLGEYLAALSKLDHQARLVKQALGEIRVSGSTNWTPEKIGNMGN